MNLRLVELDPSALPAAETCAAGFNGDRAGAREALDATFAVLTEHPRPSPWGSYLAYGDNDTPLGLCAFKFAPDAAGAVEIAYFTFPAFERQGIAAAMAARLVEIAATSGASTVVAHTLPETNASTRILIRLGFRHLGEVDDPEDGIVWRWERRTTTRAGLFDFDKAIVRAPASTVVHGLRAGGEIGPRFEDVATEHAAYVAAFRRAGLAVDVLPPLEAFPDSIFVEDPALVFAEGAILLRPGAPSRLGEAAVLSAVLNARFERVLELPGEGLADGGDILVTPSEVLIGLSGRTDAPGATALAKRLDELGYRARVAQTPAGVLHFKTACAMLDEETVVVTAALDDADIFGGLRRLRVPEGEEPAANLLRLNDVVLVGESFPRTRAIIEAHGLATLPLPVTEIGKLDAGLSCMSLRWMAKA